MLKFTKKFKSLPIVFALIGLSFIFVSHIPVAQAESISQGYQTTDTKLVVGMAASLSSSNSADAAFIEQSTLANTARFVGIVTTIDANLLTLTNKSATVHVTTVGETTGLATDLNGDIKKGDALTISPLNGVIMKADADEPKIIGTALEDFDKSVAKDQEITKNRDTKQTVKIGSVRISLDSNGLTGASTVKRPFLVLFGQSLTGRSVSQWQVLSALAIFFILITVEGSIVYGAIHSAIIAMGRNPLARSQVYKQLFQVLWLLVVVLVFGAGTIYAVLWA